MAFTATSGATFTNRETAIKAGVVPLYKRQAADQTVNASTTLVASTSIVHAVEASAVYAMRGHILSDSGTTPDVKIGWTGPSGATMEWGNTPAGAQVGQAPKAITDTATLDGAGAGTTHAHYIEGLLIVSTTAGNLTLTFAQATSDASDTKLKAGSWVTLQRLA